MTTRPASIVRLIVAVSVSTWSLACGGGGQMPADGGAAGQQAVAGDPSGTAAQAGGGETHGASADRAGAPGEAAPAGPSGASGDRGLSLTVREGAGSSILAPKADAPRVREVRVPAGTSLSLRLTSDVSSDDSRVEDSVRAVVSKPVVVDGVTVVPEGAELDGSVVDAKQSGRVKGRALVAFRFNRLTTYDARYDVRTERITRTAPATKGEDAKKIGIGAGAGAVVGAIAGGKKGTAIGSAVGAGGGTGVVLATRGREVRLPAGTVVRTKLASVVIVQVPER